MVKCPKCGFDSPEGKFCIACGQALGNIESQNYPNQENINNNDEIKFNNPQNNMNNNHEDFQRPDYSQQFQNNLKDASDINSQPKEYNPPENNQFKQGYDAPVQSNSQSNIPANQNMQMQNPYNNQGFNNQGFNNQGFNRQNNVPVNQKSKAIGLLLNFIIPGLGYGYIDRWKDAIITFIAINVLAFLGGLLLIILIGVIFIIAAIALWIYSFVKVNDMIDKYNAGLPY